jgi:TPR repeat protein
VIHVNAQFNLGACFEIGKGVAQDLVEAVWRCATNGRRPISAM